MTTTKDELVNTIQQYLKIENEMKLLQKELKERRVLKKTISESLVVIMKTNDIDCFDISDGKILYQQNKIKTPINKKHLLDCLNKYFQKIPEIQPEELTKYILDNREINVKECIRHKTQK